MKAAIRKIVAAGALVAMGFVAYPAGRAAIHATTAPAAYPFAYRHDAFCARSGMGGINVVLLGDSITDGWDDQPLWTTRFEPMGAVDYGILLDRTDNLLWRVEHGTLDGCGAKVVVLMIGTNDRAAGRSEDETIEGIAKVLAAVRSRLPRARVLLCGLLPHASHSVGTINARIKAICDGRSVVFGDYAGIFSQPGTLSADSIHPSPEGYERWAGTMLPTIKGML